MIPPYSRPPSPVPSQYPDAEQAHDVIVAADIGWHDVFTEPRLSRLLEMALLTNRDLRVALLNVEQSRSQYRITRAELFPTVDVSGAYTRERQLGISSTQSGTAPLGTTQSEITSTQWSASVGTSAYELDLFGRVRSLNAQALEQYLATEEARKSTQVILVAEAATQYFTLRQAEEQFRVAQQTLESVRDSYDLNKATFNEGAGNELDLRISEGQVQTARLNMIGYERQLAQARNALQLLIGAPLPRDLPSAAPFSVTGMLIEVSAGLPSELVRRRPDILKAERTLKAANANIGAARAAFFPTISLTGSFGSASAQLTSLFSAGTGVWSYVPQVSIPIFAGGKNRATLEAAQLSTRIAVANYEKAIQTAFREVADALVASSTSAGQITAEADLITSQQRRFDLATLRYRHGEDTYLNVLSAQQDLYTARQGLIQSQFNKLASQIALYQALGGGWK